MKTNIHIWLYLACFLLEWEIFQTKVVEKITTHSICSVTFSKSCPLWDNVEKYVELDSPQMTLWCICIACWIPKATNTHAKYVIFIAFPLHECLSILHCMCIACLVTCTIFISLPISCLSITLKHWKCCVQDGCTVLVSSLLRWSRTIYSLLAQTLLCWCVDHHLWSTLHVYQTWTSWTMIPNFDLHINFVIRCRGKVVMWLCIVSVVG